jgi:hypothetical protein
MLQAHGGNPYQVRPNDPAWSDLRDATFEHIPARDFKAGYGPLTELVEYWTYSLLSRAVADPFGQVFWFKLPYAICDAGIIAALLGLLQAMRRPSHHILIYAWSPLPVMEFWATGHNDSMMLLAIVLALWAAARERWVSAFFCLSLAAAAKLWPLALFPVFAGWKGRRPARWWQWTIALPVFGAFAWPYRGPIVENIQHVSGFLGGWRNHDSLFGLLLWLAGDQYAAKYAAFAILAAVVLLVMLLRLPLERATLIVITAMLMVSSNCHPWYLTWMMPFLALWPVPALLLWTTLAPMAYAVLIDWRLLGEWHGSTPARLWTYIPVYGLLLGTAGAALARKLKGAPAGGKLSRNISRTSESSS